MKNLTKEQVEFIAEFYSKNAPKEIGEIFEEVPLPRDVIGTQDIIILKNGVKVWLKGTGDGTAVGEDQANYLQVGYPEDLADLDGDWAMVGWIEI